MRAKAVTVLLVLVMAVFALTGCTQAQQGTVTLYDTDTVKIEREGAQTRIYDLEGGADYSFTAHKVRTPKGQVKYVSGATVAADTDTIEIKTVYGIIIVTDKTTGETLYIR